MQGSKLTYHVDAPVTLACTIDGKETPVDYDGSATFTLDVTDAQQVGETWLATELAYARDATLTPARRGGEGLPHRQADRERHGRACAVEPGHDRGDRHDWGYRDDGGYWDDRSLSRFPISSRRFCRSR